MTLDVQKWLTQMIKQQQKISHNEDEFRVFKTQKLPHKVVSDLQKEFGESYLLDSQYVIFFKADDGEYTDKDIKKIFQLVNRGLGQGANNSNVSDFKKYVPGKVSESLHEDDDEDDSDEEEDSSEETNVEEPASATEYIFVKITLK